VKQVDHPFLLQCRNALPVWKFLGILGEGLGHSGFTQDSMKNEEERELRVELERLRQEHRDLDAAIDALLAIPGYDRLQVQRLKKRKLQIRDQLSRIEDQLFPDIIA
jgi:hypothetical protein